MTAKKSSKAEEKVEAFESPVVVCLTCKTPVPTTCAQCGAALPT